LDDESIAKKESCVNTDYTGGFKITVEPDGTFVAVRGKNKLKAKSAKEINELIKNFNKEHNQVL
jgi:hypothetical protein